MFIQKFNIKNFKSFKDITLEFNQDVNILTGKNNTGKTTVLEAIALWQECFNKLIRQAGRSEKNYRKGQWVFGGSNSQLFAFDQINSVRSPNFEDIFHNRERKNPVLLAATLLNEANESLEINFQIEESGMNYVIQLQRFVSYNFTKFNDFFLNLPQPTNLVYSSPVSAIEQVENFVTDPQLNDAILTRYSASVLRNRLYRLNQRINDFSEFKRDLSFVLYNSEFNLDFQIRSNIERDKTVVVTFKIRNEIEKDIALLGSGTLQIIEILLNLYQPQKDMNIVLLDEPDSHIHRDIQKRLIQIFTKFSTKNQIFISTHNESLIRSAHYKHLFHLDEKPINTVKSIDKSAIQALQPHFKGIMPSQINPVIRSFGNINGLDFVNAIEADKLIFVEGSDDARDISRLLQEQIGSSKKNYMFWVLGGVNEIFENILAYKTVFSNITNGKSLWEKSVLIFDKDFLTDRDRALIIEKFKTKLKIPTYSWQSYTFESTVLMDLEKLAILIQLWAEAKFGENISKIDIEKSLQEEYLKMKTVLEQRYTDRHVEEISYRYKNVRIKTEKILDEKIIKENDIQITTLVNNYKQKCIDSGAFYKLLNKDDVELIIDKTMRSFGHSFSVENDFMDLIKLVNKTLWFDDWDFINEI